MTTKPTATLLLLALALILGACGSTPVIVKGAFSRGIEKYDDGDLHGAIDEYHQALESHPEDHRIHYNLGLAYHDLFRGAEAQEERDAWYAKAMGAYDRTLELVAGDPRAISSKAVLMSDAGREDDAIAYLDSASPDDELGRAFPAWTKGNLLRKKGRNDEAIASFQRALDLDENHLDSLVALAALQIDAGRFAEADELVARGLTVHAYDFGLRRAHARSAVEQARRGITGAGWDAAYYRCQTALVLIQDHFEVNRWAAEACVGMGQHEQALPHLWQARESTSPEGLRRLGVDAQAWRDACDAELREIYGVLAGR